MEMVEEIGNQNIEDAVGLGMEVSLHLPIRRNFHRDGKGVIFVLGSQGWERTYLSFRAF